MNASAVKLEAGAQQWALAFASQALTASNMRPMRGARNRIC